MAARPVTRRSGRRRTDEDLGARPLKVQVVIDTLGAGGAEESMRAVLPLVRAAGIDVQVALLRSIAPEREAALRDRGVPVEVIGPASGPVAVARAVRRLLVRARPDLLHVTLFDPVVGGAVATLGTGVPVLASMVNTLPTLVDGHPTDTAGVGWKVRAARWVEALTCRRLVTHLHAVTPGVAAAVAAGFEIDPTRITVARRGRDTARFHPPRPGERTAARSALGLGDDDEVVVALARHEPSKGLTELISAAALLAPARPALRVLIAGREGSETDAVRAAVAAHRLAGQVELLGDRNDPERLLRGADLFVLASRREGTSGATIEAMATGLPIVATDVDGLRGIVEDGINALVVPVADPSTLAAAMAVLLDDRARAAALGRGAARTFQDNFTLERSADELAALYRQVAAAGR